MTMSATGEREKQSGFSRKLTPTSPAADRAQRVPAVNKLIWPVGRWRPAVRGFSASNLRSTMRLKAMAQVRAQTIAASTRAKVRQPGQPRWSRAATAMAASANGKAKAVWENLTKEAHLEITANIGFRTLNLEPRTSNLEDRKSVV